MQHHYPLAHSSRPLGHTTWGREPCPPRTLGSVHSRHSTPLLNGRENCGIQNPAALGPGSATSWLCDLGQVADLLRAWLLTHKLGVSTHKPDLHSHCSTS